MAVVAAGGDGGSAGGSDGNIQEVQTPLPQDDVTFDGGDVETEHRHIKKRRRMQGCYVNDDTEYMVTDSGLKRKRECF